MLPLGVIAIWSGSIATIPAGWSLCDGTLGTPDLRDRFIRGASAGSPPDATGGALNHTHPFTSDGHTHTIPLGADISGGIGWTSTTNPSTDSGTTDNGSSLPPYYALAYIMRT